MPFFDKILRRYDEDTFLGVELWANGLPRRSWGTVLRMKHSRQKWIGYLLFDVAIRPSFVARLRLSPRLGRNFFKKQTSNQLDAQLVIAICAIRKTAKHYGKEPDQIRREIQDTIDTVWASADSGAREMQQRLFPKGKPTPEQFIETIGKCVQQQRNA